MAPIVVPSSRLRPSRPGRRPSSYLSPSRPSSCRRTSVGGIRCGGQLPEDIWRGHPLRRTAAVQLPEDSCRRRHRVAYLSPSRPSSCRRRHASCLRCGGHLAGASIWRGRPSSCLRPSRPGASYLIRLLCLRLRVRLLRGSATVRTNACTPNAASRDMRSWTSAAIAAAAARCGIHNTLATRHSTATGARPARLRSHECHNRGGAHGDSELPVSCRLGRNLGDVKCADHSTKDRALVSNPHHPNPCPLLPLLVNHWDPVHSASLAGDGVVAIWPFVTFNSGPCDGVVAEPFHVSSLEAVWRTRRPGPFWSLVISFACGRVTRISVAQLRKQKRRVFGAIVITIITIATTIDLLQRSPAFSDLIIFPTFSDLPRPSPTFSGLLRPSPFFRPSPTMTAPRQASKRKQTQATASKSKQKQTQSLHSAFYIFRGRRRYNPSCFQHMFCQVFAT